MGKNINKLYDKAMEYQRKGDLKKALEICEVGISKNLKNRNLLNLKGLLLYIKGELNEAIAVWKVNSDFNNDEIARVYIRDAKEDRRKLDLFNEAKSDVNRYQIDEAIEKLNMCNESDFNSLNVNYLLAFCYLRKGDYKKARNFNNKALHIDCNYKAAIELDKEIKEFFLEDNKKSNKPVMMTIITIVLIISVFLVVNKISKNHSSNDKNNLLAEENNNENNSSNELVEKEEEKKEDVNVVEEEVIEDEKTEDIKYTHNQLEEKYIFASDLFEKENYDGAIDTLKDVYNNSSDSYLNEHILFLLANSYQAKGDIDNSNKYYEMYVDRYYGESYIEEVLYRLAMNNKENNIEKSKEYARKIANDYKESIYFNTKIEEILNK